MKLVVTLLHVVALLSLGDSSRGDDVTPTGCTVTPDKDQGMHVQLNKMAVRCLMMDRITIDHINEIDTLEGHKSFVKNLCDKKSDIRECLTGVTRSSDVCDTEMGHKFFLIFRDLLETILDAGCAQDGEILAKTFMTYNISETPPFKSDHFHYCVNTGLTRIVRLLDPNIEPHSRFFSIYRVATHTKECFGDIDVGDITLMKAIESLLGEVVDQMKCMHPQDETPVLCKSIDVNLPDVPRICPIKTLDEEKQPLKNTLLEIMSWCVTSTFLDEESLNMIDSRGASMMFIDHNCETKDAIGKCLSDVLTLSSVCLNEKQHNAMKLADDFLKHGMDSLCNLDGGIAAAYLLYKTLTKTDATLQNNDVRDCMAIARPYQEILMRHLDAADFLKYYQELKVFKRCLLDKMYGDNRAVFNIYLIFSSLQRSIKCLDPVHGTMVHCKSIETAPSTEVKVCPFVGEHKNESPDYETILDMTTVCIKSSIQDPDRLRKFNTLEQFQTFFKAFCHHRPTVEHCVDDITSISEKCLSHDDHQMLTIFTDGIASVMKAGCEQDGEVFATIMNGLMVDVEHGIPVNQSNACTEAFVAGLGNHVTVSVAVTSSVHYHMVVNLTQCFLDGASEVGSFKTVLTKFTNDIRKDLKCVRPGDATIGICESFLN